MRQGRCPCTLLKGRKALKNPGWDSPDWLQPSGGHGGRQARRDAGEGLDLPGGSLCAPMELSYSAAFHLISPFGTASPPGEAMVLGHAPAHKPVHKARATCRAQGAPNLQNDQHVPDRPRGEAGGVTNRKTCPVAGERGSGAATQRYSISGPGRSLVLSRE